MGWVVNTTSWPLCSRKISPDPLCRRLGGPQGRPGRLRKISTPPQPGFDPRAVQPVASYYTDCAFPAHINLLMPNDDYSGRTAPLTSKRCILCIYSTNTGTEYFKLGIYSPLFPLQNVVCFIIVTYLVPVLFTFYIQCVLKF